MEPFNPLGKRPAPAFRPNVKPQVPPPQFRLPVPVTATKTSAPVSTHVGFEQATRQLGESIQALPQHDRKEIQIIHRAVDEWADQNPGADRLGQFVFRAMDYTNRRLEQLESAGSSTGECGGLEKVFFSGYQMVEAYAAL